VVKPVLVASRIPGYDLLIFANESSDQQIEGAAKIHARNIRNYAKKVKIISNEPITLSDGTLAYESVIEYKSAGIYKSKSIHLSVFKDDHRITINILTNANYYNEELRDIFRSLEFN
jgi:hypothetical protein